MRCTVPEREKKKNINLIVGKKIMFLGLSLAAWFVVAVVVVVFLLQILTKLPSDFVFLGGMGLLLVSGVIPANSVLVSCNGWHAIALARQKPTGKPW